VWSATRTLKSWSSVIRKCLVLHAKAIRLRDFFLFSAIRAMATSQVHRALPAVLVVPPVVQPAVGHSSALTPPGAKSENPLSLPPDGNSLYIKVSVHRFRVQRSGLGTVSYTHLTLPTSDLV